MLATARERVASGLVRKKPLRNALHVLSIDGGGIKGLVPLHILLHAEKLFATVSRSGKSFIKQFNFFAGTSTGSIIASGLVKGMQCSSIPSALTMTSASSPFAIEEII